jgi:Cys-tRNA(Pro) deacylase
MRAPKHPVTMAVRALRAANVAFEPHAYAWHAHGGTRASAEALGVDEHAVVKTLIFEDQAGAPLCILMHGDREVSTKQLARQVGAREVAPASPDAVEKHTGYVPGGVSPFGPRKRLPVYVERTVLTLPRVLVNGGRRGFLVEIEPAAFTAVLGAIPVEVAI